MEEILSQNSLHHSSQEAGRKLQEDAAEGHTHSDIFLPDQLCLQNFHCFPQIW